MRNCIKDHLGLLMLFPIGTLLGFFPVTARAQFSYALNPDFTATITGYSGPGGTVIIPATINLLPVIAITNGAFQSLSTITSIWMTNNVRTVGTSAFGGCGSLTNAVFGDNVTNIGDVAFQNCPNLSRVAIGSGVNRIGTNAFLNYGLLEIDVDGNNNTYTSLNGVLFDKARTTLVQFPIGRTGSYAIPDSVLKVSDYSFAFCNLSALTFGSNVVVIGYAAFVSFSNLTSITIPDSTKTIGDMAFSNPFDGTFPIYTNKLAAVTIGNGVTNIGNSAFSGCTALSKLTLGNSVTVIGDYTFYFCINLTDCTLPNSLTSIGSHAFANCARLPKMTIPDRVSNLGVYAFYLSGVTNVVIGSGITNLQDYVFHGCFGLQSITIPTNVSILGFDAFGYTYSLATVTIESGLTRIGYWAFINSGLTSIVIPDTVTNITIQAFSGCGNLTNVIIGRGVSSIDGTIFDGCSNLAGLYFLGNAPPPTVLRGPTHLIVYYVPGTSGWGTTWSGVLTLPIAMQIQVPDPSFGVHSNQFGFNITGSYGLTVAVEAATNLLHPVWTPLQTNTLPPTPMYFSDPQSTNYPNRFYRVRWP